MMLRPSQQVGLFGGIERGLGAVGPGETASAGDVDGHEVRRADGEHAGLSLNHDVAGVGSRAGDHRDTAAGVLAGLGDGPLGAGPRLAEPSAGEQEPL